MSELADGEGGETTGRKRGLRAWKRWVPFVLVGVAAAVPRLVTAGNFETIDEPGWLVRSELFAAALTGGDPASMTVIDDKAATMPGITTMWVGTLAKGLFALGGILGLVPDGTSFVWSTQGVAVAQGTMAVATAALVGLTSWFAARWASWRVGIAFGLLLATEPFWVAHGAVLHTDELLALFGIGGLLALAIALGVPRPGGTDPSPREAERIPIGWTVAAGVLLACAALTKLSGLVWGVTAGLIVAWAAVGLVRVRDRTVPWWQACRPLLAPLGIGVVAGLVTVAVLYPAVVVDPVEQWNQLFRSARLGGLPRRTFFMGEIVQPPPASFYAWTLPWRTTPWALAVLVVGIPVALVRGATRWRALVMVVSVVPATVLLTIADAKYDRYGLMILAPLLLAGCLALQPRSAQVPAGHLGRRPWFRFERPAWLAAGFAGVFFAASVAPWGLLYFNPVLGGGSAAQSRIPVGWYEESNTALALIRADVEAGGGDCLDVTSTGYRAGLVLWTPCGWRVAVDDESADYMAVGIVSRQLLDPEEYRGRTAGRELVAVEEVRGIRYMEIWRRPRAAEATASTP